MRSVVSIETRGRFSPRDFNKQINVKKHTANKKYCLAIQIKHPNFIILGG